MQAVKMPPNNDFVNRCSRNSADSGFLDRLFTNHLLKVNTAHRQQPSGIGVKIDTAILQIRDHET